MRYDLTEMCSLESIDYQTDNFHEVLSGVFRDYKEHKSAERLKKEFDKIATARFGIKFDFGVENSYQVNAYAYIRALDDRTVLLRTEGSDLMFDAYSEYFRKDNKGIVKRIAKGDLTNTGLMDYKKAKVSGIFSQIPATVKVTKGALKEIEPEELAAIMLHEIGHIWTFFEFLGIYSFRNAIIQNTVKEFLDVKAPEEKIKIIIDKNNYWNLKIPEELPTKMNDDDCTKVIIGSYMRNFTQDAGYVEYNNNTSEVIADQFATRFGAGKYIVTGLNRFLGNREGSENISQNLWLATALAVSILSITASPLISVIGVLGMLGAWMDAGRSMGWTYDNDKDRYKRVRNEVVGRLKDPKISDELRVRVLADIKTIDAIESKVSVHEHIGHHIRRFFSKSFREMENKRIYQQQVEALLANNLYVQGNELKTLK
nr:MAG TPA: peptidase [Caudoviricetes sp.]